MAVVAKIVMEENGLFSEDKLIERGDIRPCVGCDSLRVQAYEKRREYHFIVMWIEGLLQLLCGVFQFGRLVRLIPQTVMTGFVNGLAIIIFSAQLESFQEIDWQKAFDEFDTNQDGLIEFTEITKQFHSDLPALNIESLAVELNNIVRETGEKRDNMTDIFISGLPYVDTTEFESHMVKVLNETDSDQDFVITYDEFSSDKDDPIHDGHKEYKKWRTLNQGSTWMMLLYSLGSMFIVHFLPKVTKVIPSSLVAILLCLLIEHTLNRMVIHADTPVVSDMASVEGAFPSYHTPNIILNAEACNIVMPTCLSLMAVGLIESVLTLQLVDEILEDTSGGGTEEKPVGTIWIAYADEEKCVSKKLNLSKSRDLNIKYTGIGLLNLIRQEVIKETDHSIAQ